MFESCEQWHHCATTGGEKMWVSSVTSNHRSATARRGSGRNNDRTTIIQHFEAFAWNAALTVCAAIILLNTVGLISVVCADTIQYPVTAPIPPGKSKTFEHLSIYLNRSTIRMLNLS